MINQIKIKNVNLMINILNNQKMKQIKTLLLNKLNKYIRII